MSFPSENFGKIAKLKGEKTRVLHTFSGADEEFGNPKSCQLFSHIDPSSTPTKREYAQELINVSSEEKYFTSTK